MFYIIIVVVVILLLLFIIGNIDSKENSQPNNASKVHSSFGDAEYRREILNGVGQQNRNDFSRLYSDLADIQRKIDTFSTLIDVQKENAIADINSKITETQRQIEQRWNISQRNKNYYEYIGLHYASFMLADTIKREQVAIRNIFVNTKNQMDQLSGQIDALSNQINRAKGNTKYELMQKHKQLCQQHKRLSSIKNVFGKRNSEYHALLTAQNRKTVFYREYIRNNCGKKGRDWATRLDRRKIDQITLND